MSALADPLFTKTEATRRLRLAGQMARKIDSLPKNALMEVDIRTHPDYTDDPANWQRHSDDDLVEFWRLSQKGEMPEDFRFKGAVVDLSLSTVDPYWGQELANKITIWMGDDTHEPQLMRVPGRTQERIDQINAEYTTS